MPTWQRLTQLHIAKQLALLLTSCVLISALVVGGVLAVNLRAGFDEYLRAKDVAQAQRMASFLAEHMRTDPQMTKLRDGPQGMRTLLTEFSRREGLAVQGLPPSDPRSPDGMPPASRPAGQRGQTRGGLPPAPDGMDGPIRPSDLRWGSDGPPPRAELPGRPMTAQANEVDHHRPVDERADIERARARGRGGQPSSPPGGAIGPRLQIFDANGAWVAGRQQPLGTGYFTTPVVLDGRTVAQLRVTEEHSREAVDAYFLKRQYWGLGLAVALVTLLAAGVAMLVARRWTQPVREVQLATRRIADGAFDARVTPSGARELADLAGDVNRMGEALGQLEASRKRWIAQTAHELRTPLAVLQGELESAEDGARKTTPQWLKRLVGEVKHLARLVQDLHTLSVSDMGRPGLTPMDLDAGQLLRDAHERHAERVAARRLKLELEVVESASVRWDMVRIAQVLDNLIENSRRYTDAPGTIRLSGQALAAMYRFRVDDSAPGVAASELPMLFEPLYRSDGARTRSFDPSNASSGSGLGLAIVKAMVQAHGGQVQASASPLGGLRMEVLLPWQLPADSRASHMPF